MSQEIHSIVGDKSKGAINEKGDVQTVQKLLYLASLCTGDKDLDPKSHRRCGPFDGKISADAKRSGTVMAIRHFQQTATKATAASGLIEPDSDTLKALNELVDSKGGSAAEPPWVRVARQEIGTEECPTLGNNSARVLEYIHSYSYLSKIPYRVSSLARVLDKAGKPVLGKDGKPKMEKRMENSGYNLGDVDETPWCACFVNWCLAKAGYPKGASARARDWADYGFGEQSRRLGCIAVIYRKPSKATSGTTSSGFHVGFYVRSQGNQITLLGGNQDNKVCVNTFTGWKVLALRWPVLVGDFPMPRQDGAAIV